MDAYNVAIRVSLINAVSGGLLKMIGQFRGAEVAAAGLRKEIAGIKGTMLLGAGLTAAGVGMLAMFKPALEQARQFQQEVTKFSLYGMGDQATSEAVRFAKGMNIAGTSYVDAMRMMTEAQGIFRESGKRTLAEQLQGAKIAAPIMAKLAFIESGLNDDQRSSRHAQDLAMLRFIEARGGANDPRTFASIADWGYKLQQSSGGVVDWSQLQQLVATSGAAGYNLTQDAISALEPVIADLKGGRLGSGLRVAFQRLLGTQRGLPKQAIAEYLSLGLWDPSKVELNAQGGIKRFLGAPGDVLRDRVKFGTDPEAYYVQDFLTAIGKKYGAQILGNTPQAKIERAAEISMVFGPGNASAVFSQVDKLLPAIQRSLAAQQRQLGINAAYTAVGKSPAGQIVDLRAQYSNVLEATGEAAMPAAIAAMKALIPIFKSISAFATDHPTAFKNIVDGILGLGAALTLSGVATGLIGLTKAVMLVGKVFTPLATVLRLITATPLAGGIVNLALKAAKLPLIGTGLEGIATAVAALGASPLLVVVGGITALAGAFWLLPRALKAAADAILNLLNINTNTAWNAGHGGRGPQKITPPVMSTYGPKPGTRTGRGIVGGVPALQPKPVVGAVVPRLVVNAPRRPVASTAPRRPTAYAPPAAHHAAAVAAQHMTTAFVGSQVAVSRHQTAVTNATKSTNSLWGAEQKFASWLLGAINTLSAAMANFGAQGGKAAVPPPRASQPIQVHTSVNMDGRRVATIVSHHQAAAIGGQRAGNARFDHGTGLPASGAPYHQ